MFGIFKRDESKKIKELNEKIEELDGNVGKLSYELQSLRNRYNKQLGSVAAKMKKSDDEDEDEEEEVVAKPNLKGRWNVWVSKLNAEERDFLNNALPEERERLKQMVEEGLI